MSNILDSNILRTYVQLKNKMDAAYLVLKKDPSVTNATIHTLAAQAFTTFCVDTMKDLTGVHQESSNKQAEILADLNANSTEEGTTSAYLTCAEDSCGTQLVFPVGDPGNYTGFIESIDFVPDFPGWCHKCLVDHCSNTDCADCTICPTPSVSTCPYHEVKKIYTEPLI